MDRQISARGSGVANDEAIRGASTLTTATQRYRVVSLFSGAMGLDLGLAATGRFELLACVEKVPAFCATIRKNQAGGRLGADVRLYEADIRDVDPHTMMADLDLRPGDLDVLVGGPPCQSFSTAGRRGTVEDPRGTLLWQFLRFVEAIRPKFFVMENVRGLVSAALHHRPIANRPEKGGPPLKVDEKPGSVIARFSRDLQAIDGAPYHMDCFEVNAVNYGAPQLRERVLFIGNRFNSQIEFPQPTHGAPSATAASATLFTDPQPVMKPWSTLGEALRGLRQPRPEVMDFSPRKKSFLKLVPPGANWRSLPIDVQKESMGRAWHAKGGRSGWWRRLTFDLPCPTVVTMPNHASTSLCHPTKTRALSLQEYARVQEFPDDWQFCGTTPEKYAQVGNAVPTRLGLVAGMTIVEALDRLRERRWRGPAEAPVAFRVVYVQSHVRTRQWFKNGETVVWDGDDVARYGQPRTIRRERNLSLNSARS